MFPMVVMGQDAPLECDNNYGECGTPEMSGGGNAGGGGSILIANSDLGDTYCLLCTSPSPRDAS